MIVKVSKLMATAIRKAVKPYRYNISLEKVASAIYQQYVDYDLFAHEKDYEASSNSFRVIKDGFISEVIKEIEV